jgi:pre-mRNA-splicing factor CWC26
MSSLSSYLASKYLNASSSSKSKDSKKRKRKNPSGLIIADDDEPGWSSTPANTSDNEDGPSIAQDVRSAEFKKTKKSSWKTVGAAAPSDSDQAAADAILASAAQEAGAGRDDEGPVIEETEDNEVVKMESGAHAGLQTAEQVTEQFERRKREERRKFEDEERAAGRDPRKKNAKTEEETVYRDATGRRIDLAMKRADKRKELDELERKKREEEDMQKGDVQLAERKRRREELDEARFMPLARKIDDEEMNNELKERGRWNDPAMQFLVAKTETKSRTGKPLYKGASMPNRYGIRPGYRWDGVDRSNGWEGERFKALNRRTRNKELDYAWQMDE